MFTLNGKYTSAKIMIDDVEEACIAQITKFINNPAFTNPVAIMPDCHAGKGIMKFEKNKDIRLCKQCGKMVEIGDECQDCPDSKTEAAYDCSICGKISTKSDINKHYARHYIDYDGPMSKELRKLVELVKNES